MMRSSLDLLLFPHDIQDLTQAAGRALQNGAQEMLPLVHGRIHAEEHALRLCVKHRRAFALEIRQVDQARPRRQARPAASSVKRAHGGDVEHLLRPRDRAPGALLRAEHVAAVAVERADVEDAGAAGR